MLVYTGLPYWCWCPPLYCYRMRYVTGKNLIFPHQYAMMSSLASSSSDMTSTSDLSITTEQECIGTTSGASEKKPRVHWLMYDVLSNRSNARFSAVPNHAQACRSLIHTCKDMRPCSGTVCLMATFNEGDLAPSRVNASLVGGRNY